MSGQGDTPLVEGQILSARIDEQGVLRAEIVEHGEVRTHGYDREGFSRDGVYYPPPPVTEDILPAPVPTEVAITSANELDAMVHAMAIEAQHTDARAVIEAEPEPVAPSEVTHGSAYTVMERDQYGDVRGHTYDFEPVMRSMPAPVYDVGIADHVEHAEGDAGSVPVIHEAAHDNAHHDATSSHSTGSNTDESAHANDYGE